MLWQKTLQSELCFSLLKYVADQEPGRTPLLPCQRVCRAKSRIVVKLWYAPQRRTIMHPFQNIT